MALFIFGAGSVRGCSFVDPTKDPCLPPLDSDFFIQLQRVRNAKHRLLINSVINDVIELFGQAYDVTMERVFTTIEHAIRMIEVTEETRDFKKADLKSKRDNLVQAIAVVLEDSLTKREGSSASMLSPRPCDHHKKFVKNILSKNDDIISFNYDCVLDYALKEHGDDKWDARYGYGFKLGSRGTNLTGDAKWQSGRPAGRNTAHLYKLHGSLHFQEKKCGDSIKVHLKERPYTRQRGKLKFTIIPPEWHKAYDEGIFATLWRASAAAVHSAEEIILIGYSMPITDLHSNALFQTAVRKSNLNSLVIVNPDKEARKRTISVFQRALKPESRVLFFDEFCHFVAADRKIWDLT